MLILSETRKEEAKKEHNSTIIFFHGIGQDNRCIGHFNSSMQEKFPHTKFIFPQASKKEWKVEGMFSAKNTNWYCIKTTRDRLFTPNPPQTIEEVEEWGKKVKVNEEHLRSLIFEVHKIIQAEINKGIKPENIVLAGYSHGGSAALATGLTFKEPLGGIISLSSFLPWSPKIYDLLNKSSSEKKKVPVLFCNGTDDELVPFWTGEMSAKILKLCGYSKVEFHGYPGQGHSTNCDKELNNFLERILPKKEKKRTAEENNSNDLPPPKKPKIEEEATENERNDDSPDNTETPKKDLKNPQIPTPPAENSDKNLENKDQERPREAEKPDNKIDNDFNNHYETWTHQQILAEIQKLKAEIETLKKDSSSLSAEKQVQLRIKLEKLEKAKSKTEENESSKPSPFGFNAKTIGGGLLLIISLIIIIAGIKLVVKKKK